ncbi:unnamed protein product [Callosobruchus maculatus]|uniref:Uncharacterized protein n=1 Tax=Callosobruchus maculatus TaxID=64391 RepID=A0A653CQM5_CALMS|nr:unnamed protein product [Callosobruchus maculatus]
MRISSGSKSSLSTSQSTLEDSLTSICSESWCNLSHKRHRSIFLQKKHFTPLSLVKLDRVQSSCTYSLYIETSMELQQSC